MEAKTDNDAHCRERCSEVRPKAASKIKDDSPANHKNCDGKSTRFGKLNRERAAPGEFVPFLIPKILRMNGGKNYECIGDKR